MGHLLNEGSLFRDAGPRREQNSISSGIIVFTELICTPVVYNIFCAVKNAAINVV